MPGIDILAMEEVAVEWAFNWLWFWIVVAIFGVIGLIWTICSTVKGDFHWITIPVFTIVLMLIGAFIGLAPGFGAATPTKYETRYKVTISDEVKMTEFLEKYEIIKTEGKIYTVREK